jgi:hypothetical protein
VVADVHGELSLKKQVHLDVMNMNRRSCLYWLGSSLCGGALAGLLSRPAQLRGQAGAAADEFIDDRTEKAINLGLDYLAERQNDQGSFDIGSYRSNVAVVSLAGLAWLSQGSLPGEGPYSRELKRCFDFILEHCEESGFITARDFQSHGPMYGHGFATLFFAEVYGAAPSDERRVKLEKAVQLIIDTQNDQGGWRYLPQRNDADLSVTICQVMALRAARNAGIYVPNDTIEKCVEYVKRSQNSDGGFMYLPAGGESAFPRSAAGVCALFSAGVYEGKEITRGLDYLMNYIPDGRRNLREAHYFYGHYYAAQAMWQGGDAYWRKWYPAIRDDLLKKQHTDGSWIDLIASEYGTAMACIILQMPNQLLPIFQR